MSLTSGPQEESDTEGDENPDDKQASHTPAKIDDGNPSMQEGIQVLEGSQSCRIIEEMLSTYYAPLEVWYARTVIDKACYDTQTCLFLVTHGDDAGTQVIDA